MTDTKINALTELLSTGRDNAISWRLLADSIGARDRREVNAAIAQARASGFIILPDNRGGYYMPDIETADGRAEIEKFIHHGHNMAISIFKGMKSARVALNDYKEREGTQ